MDINSHYLHKNDRNVLLSNHTHVPRFKRAYPRLFTLMSDWETLRAVQCSQLDRVSREMAGKKLVPSARFV